MLSNTQIIHEEKESLKKPKLKKTEEVIQISSVPSTPIFPGDEKNNDFPAQKAVRKTG